MSKNVMIKPCPKCGHAVWLMPDFSANSIHCPNCGIRSARYDDKDKMIADWNDRPIEKKQATRIAALESLFADPYFKGLKPAEVIELAKKSIRLSKDNCELRDQVEELERQVEDLREDLTMAVCGKEDREDN